MAISTSIFFLLLGGTIGLIWILGLGGFRLIVPGAVFFFPFHKYVMLHGFVTLFIMGVGFMFFPHVKKRQTGTGHLIASLTAYGAIAASVTLRVVAGGERTAASSPQSWSLHLR